MINEEFTLIDYENNIIFPGIQYERTDIEEDAILRLHTRSGSKDNFITPFNYKNSNTIQESIQLYIEDNLNNIIYIFSSPKSTQQYDVRRLIYAPISILYYYAGENNSCTRQIVQEFIDLFKTVKMIIYQLDDAKIIINSTIIWNTEWEYIKWSSNILVLKEEILDLYRRVDYTQKFNELDGYTVIEYNPEYNISSSLIHKRIKPSIKEMTKKINKISIHAIDINWYHNLRSIFYKYLYIDKSISISLLELFYKLKSIYNEISIEDQQILITICEDVLGGISLENISNNLEKWIKINYDIIPSSISLLY